MSYSITILFGSEEVKHFRNGEILTHEEMALNLKSYSFNTKEELNAFMKGIEEGVGWLEYHVLEESDLNKFNILTRLILSKNKFKHLITD